MNVYDSPRERAQHGLFQNSHETSEDHQVHGSLLKQPNQFHFCSRFETSPEFSWRQIEVRHGKLAGDIQNAGVEVIGGYQPRLGRQISGTDLFEDRSAITSLARSENAKPELLHNPAPSFAPS